MTRPIAASTVLIVLIVLFAPAARAGQEVATWEFHFFGGRAVLDNKDPLALKFSSADGDLTRSLDIKDDGFVGFRLGYVWTPQFESEVSYDRNHAGGTYRQTIVDDPSGTGQGGLTSIITSYQVGALYHPLATWKTRWQPYLTAAIGWTDVDFDTSVSAGRLRDRASTFLGVDLPPGDKSLMVGYGVGVKFYAVQNFAIRGEVRGKSYDLFDERRNDREYTLGFSFFAPSPD